MDGSSQQHPERFPAEAPGALVGANANALLAALQDGLLVRDMDGVIRQVNDRFCSLVGLPRERLLGSAPPFPYWESADADPLAAIAARAVSGVTETDARFRRPDGSIVEVILSVAPVRGPGGETVGLLETVKDVTDRKRDARRVLEAAERYRAIVETAVSAVIVIDEHGIVDAANPAVQRMFGYRPDELVGRNVSVLMNEPERSEHDGYVARFAGGGAPRIIGIGRRVLGRRRDGTPVWVHLSVGEMRIGDRRMFTGVMHDVDALVAAELELRAERDRAERLAAEQAVLARIAGAIAEEGSPEHVVGLVAEGVADALSTTMAAVIRFDASDATVVSSFGFVSSYAAGAVLPRIPGGPVERVRTSDRPVRLDGLGLLPPDHPVRRGLEREGVGCIVVVPITVRARTWGVLVAAERHPLPRDAEERLDRFGRLVTTAISQADARRLLISQATTDPLTGLANHRVFHERLAAEFTRAAHHGRDLAVAVFDLDMLKQVNDTFGHQTGDHVIAEAAARIATLARPGDLMARIGGDEFGWILPETTGLGGHQAADRARRLLSGSPIGEVGLLSVSVGVAAIDQATSAAELFRLADGALYTAKAHGRDATFLYSPDVVQELSAAERAQRLMQAQALAGLRALARAIDAKDPSTKLHSERVAHMADRIAAEMGWPDGARARLHEAALLHDVGKIGVPDAILFKPERLTVAEYAQVREHAALGALIAGEVLDAEQVAWLRGHHERWDGLGYPDGLSGTRITEGARILCLADSWDVMTSERPYQGALSYDAAVEEVTRMRGSQFCPECVDALGRVLARAAWRPEGSRR